MNSNIFQKIERSTKPDFGDIFSKSFDLFLKLFMEAVKHGLASLLVVIPFILIVYVPLMPMYIELLMNTGDPYYHPTGLEEYSIVMMIIWVIAVFLISFVLQIVILSINAHFYKVCKNFDLGIDGPTGGYFDLLKNNFGKLLLLSLATFGIAMLAALLCYLPIFYVLVPLQLFLPILSFNDKLSVTEIIKAAFKLGNKYWLIIFGLVILSSIIAQLGIILCGIGLVVTAYFVHIVMYYLYKDTVGFDERSEENTF
jgi:magnesium-transporting ATPase (P-type)